MQRLQNYSSRLLVDLPDCKNYDIEKQNFPVCVSPLSIFQARHFSSLARADFSSVRSKATAEIGQATDEVVQPLSPLFPTVHGDIGN